MNNLNTIGKYMTNLQQNISLLAQGVMEARSEIDILKKSTNPTATPISETSLNEVANISQDVVKLNNEVVIINKDIITLKSEVAGIHQDIVTLMNVITNKVQKDIVTLEKCVADMVEKMGSLDQIIKTSIDTSIESIFSSLPSSQQSLHQQPSKTTSDINNTSDNDDIAQGIQMNDDIEIVAKKIPVSKKKTPKKTVNV